MKIIAILASAAAATLVIAPLAAHASAAERATAPIAGEQDLGGSSLIIGVLAVAAVVAGIVLIADGNGTPASQ